MIHTHININIKNKNKNKNKKQKQKQFGSGKRTIDQFAKVPVINIKLDTQTYGFIAGEKGNIAKIDTISNHKIEQVHKNEHVY